MNDASLESPLPLALAYTGFSTRDEFHHHPEAQEQKSRLGQSQCCFLGEKGNLILGPRFFSIPQSYGLAMVTAT